MSESSEVKPTTHLATGKPLLRLKGQVKPENWLPLTHVVPQASKSHATEFANEKALQEVLHEHPSILPVKHFWKSADDWEIVSLGREIQLKSTSEIGMSVDNIYLTRSGKLVIVEAKLFRNHEQRRKVVSQIIEYAAQIAQLTLESFEKTLKTSKQGILAPTGIAPSDGQFSTLEEFYHSHFPGGRGVQFVDDFTMQLQRGEFLLLIVGDGIQSGLADLARYVDGNAHLHYRLSLVAVHEYVLNPTQAEHDTALLVPQVIADVPSINRGVFSFEVDNEGRTQITYSQSEESNTELMDLPRFLASIKNPTHEAMVFAEELHMAVESHPELEVKYLATYWDIRLKSNGILLARNAHSVGGSLSFNEGLRTLKKTHEDLAREYVRRIDQLSNVAEAKPGGLEVTKQVPYSELVDKKDEFWEVIHWAIDAFRNL